MTSRALLDRLDAEFEPETGLQVRFYDVLAVLEDAPDGMRMNELAERIRYSKGGLTRVIDEMENAGLVRRHRPEGDRRSIFLFITAKGTEARQHARPIHHEWIKRNFADLLDRGELEALIPAFEKLHATHSRRPGGIAG
jgi:DNA-binding MarR family transcriptional regulator